jgi:hypothetical protein
MSEVKDQIKSLQKELESKNLKNAHSDYMKAFRQAFVINVMIRE